MLQTTNIPKYTITIVDPTGVLKSIDVKIPTIVPNTEIIADAIVTALKLLNNLIADNAGKINNALINKLPTRFIANTIITAVITAITQLYNSVLLPVAFMKFSSNVTAKILL